MELLFQMRNAATHNESSDVVPRCNVSKDAHAVLTIYVYLSANHVEHDPFSEDPVAGWLGEVELMWEPHGEPQDKWHPAGENTRKMIQMQEFLPALEGIVWRS